MIRFEYCPVLGLKWCEFKKPYLDKAKKSKKRRTASKDE